MFDTKGLLPEADAARCTGWVLLLVVPASCSSTERKAQQQLVGVLWMRLQLQSLLPAGTKGPGWVITRTSSVWKGRLIRFSCMV